MRREVVFTRKKWEKVVKDHPNPDTSSQLEESTVSMYLEEESEGKPSLKKSTCSTVKVYVMQCHFMMVENVYFRCSYS